MTPFDAPVPLKRNGIAQGEQIFELKNSHVHPVPRGSLREVSPALAGHIFNLRFYKS